jgi:hypothetical protein
MSLGVSALSTNQHKESSGSPFATGSANNGLSVDAGTGKIVLGNDSGGSLAALLSDREIPLSGFSIGYIGSAKNIYTLPDGSLRIGPDSVSNGAKFQIVSDGNEPEQLIQDDTNGYQFFLVDSVNDMFALGDITGKTNALQLFIDNSNFGRVIALGDYNQVKGQSVLRIDDANSDMQFTSIAGHTFLDIDGANQVYQLGNRSYINQISLTLDGAAKTATFENVSNDVDIVINGQTGFTGTVTPVNSITVVGGIVTNVT